MERYKLAVVLTHPIQYHVPVFRALARDPRVDLTVYYCCELGATEQRDPEFGTVFKWDIPLLEGYRHVFLRNWSRRPRPSFLGCVNPGIIGELRRERFDAVLVYGYSVLTAWLAFLGGWLTRTPVFLRGVTHLLDDKPLHRRLAKRLLLTPLFRTMSICLYVGNHNREYYRAYGVPDEKLVHAPHVVSNEFFARHRERLRPRRGEVREAFGIGDDAPVILLPAKLVPWKNPLVLLEAFRRVRRKHRCHLLYAGDGAEREKIERRVREQEIPDVVIAGFLNQTEMPKAYVAADVLCLPSQRETWGLVVNEGMNFDLPVVISHRVGCSTDLVRHGDNGFIVDSVDALERALEELVCDPEKREVMGARSRKRIEGWGVSECAEGIVEGLRRVRGEA